MCACLCACVCMCVSVCPNSCQHHAEITPKACKNHALITCDVSHTQSECAHTQSECECYRQQRRRPKTNIRNDDGCNRRHGDGLRQHNKCHHPPKSVAGHRPRHENSRPQLDKNRTREASARTRKASAEVINDCGGDPKRHNSLLSCWNKTDTRMGVANHQVRARDRKWMR